MEAEILAHQQAELDKWIPLILGAVPLRFGVEFTTLMENVQDAWEETPNPPCSPATYAVFDLARQGVLEINDHVIRRKDRINRC